MIYRAHRGNINGINTDRENHPDYITEALKKDFNVEIDVWFDDNKWILGHDVPEYEIKLEFLYNRFLWCHAKNIDALQTMRNSGIHCFWHQNDDVVLTSKGYLWTFPGKKLFNLSICVMPEAANYKNKEIHSAFGICSDFIERYRK